MQVMNFLSLHKSFHNFLSSPHTQKKFLWIFLSFGTGRKVFFNYISFVILLIAFNSSSCRIATPFFGSKKWHRAQWCQSNIHPIYREIISGLFTPGLELLESKRRRKTRLSKYLFALSIIFMTVDHDQGVGTLLKILS